MNIFIQKTFLVTNNFSPAESSSLILNFNFIDFLAESSKHDVAVRIQQNQKKFVKYSNNIINEYVKKLSFSVEKHTLFFSTQMTKV